MKKTIENKRKEVEEKLRKQQIRDIKDLDAYKLDVCHPYAAGIDIGSREIYLAIPPVIAAEMALPIVHKFSTFTSGLLQCRQLLRHCGITTVAMESTSIYWSTLFFILQDADMKVCLTNPKKFRMVPGRKTDVLDCQWLQTLHTYGLLRGSFHPDNLIDMLRTYMREREKLIQERSRFVQRMQKALTRMNLLLHNVLSDITGESGMRIIRAILQGERDAQKLAELRDHRCRASKATIAESLQGYYREDQLYLLQMNYDSYMFFEKQISQLDTQIDELLKQFPLKEEPQAVCPEFGKTKQEKMKNSVRTKDNLEDMLYRILGVNLAAITGIRGHTILQISAEVGMDMEKFPTADHFVAYLGFVPRNKITGGKIISSRTDRIKSSAAQAFKKVIPSISQTNTQLGAFYRRMAPRIGKGPAITATCRKLAILYYNSLRFGEQFIENGQEQYMQRQQEYEKKKLTKLAKKYNMTLQPIEMPMG